MRALGQGLSEWVVASHNPGKLRELVALFAELPIRLLPAVDLGLHAPEETGETFEENALLKAVAAARASGLPAVSDDSGLCVHALGGEPGVRTARWAGPNKDFRVAHQKVHERLLALGERANPRATLVSALSVAEPDGSAEAFVGRIDGVLVWPPRGEYGFGFEPMFLPDGYAVTYGEMSPAWRHRVNPRAEAMRRLLRFYRHLSSE
jgi:XTP/dITP diphosphohydrolase